MSPDPENPADAASEFRRRRGARHPSGDRRQSPARRHSAQAHGGTGDRRAPRKRRRSERNCAPVLPTLASVALPGITFNIGLDDLHPIKRLRPVQFDGTA